jgi:hypothetical protein
MCQIPDHVAPQMRTSPFKPFSLQDVFYILLTLIVCLRLLYAFEEGECA